MIHPRHTAIRYSTSMLKQETCPCAARGRVAGPISMHDGRCHLLATCLALWRGRTSEAPKVTHKGQTCSPKRDGRMCLQVVKP